MQQCLQTNARYKPSTKRKHASLSPAILEALFWCPIPLKKMRACKILCMDQATFSLFSVKKLCQLITIRDKSAFKILRVAWGLNLKKASWQKIFSTFVSKRNFYGFANECNQRLNNVHATRQQQEWPLKNKNHLILQRCEEQKKQKKSFSAASFRIFSLHVVVSCVQNFSFFLTDDHCTIKPEVSRKRRPVQPPK